MGNVERCDKTLPVSQMMYRVRKDAAPATPGGCGPRYFWADEAFDRWFLDLLERGDHQALLRECTLARMEAAGSGGTAELLAWVLVLASTAGPADVLAYMPAIAWRSGTGMVVWNELAG